METTREAQVDSQEQDMLDDYLEYKQVEDALACPVVDIREPNDDTIALVVDTPSEGNSVWHFEKPYIWSDDNSFADLCSQRGYTRETFDLLTDDLVLIQKNDNNDQQVADSMAEWQLLLEPPNSYNPNEGSENRTSTSTLQSRIKQGTETASGSVLSLLFTLGMLAIGAIVTFFVLTIGFVAVFGRKIAALFFLALLLIIFL